MNASMIFVALLAISGMAVGQAEQQKKTLIVSGGSGEAIIIQMNGRSYVDLEALARISNGSLGFQGSRVVLTLPASTANGSTVAPATSQPANSGLSKAFQRASIEETAVIREWRSALAYSVQNGYPVASGWIAHYLDHATETIDQTSAAASTTSDRNALRLLTNQFNNVHTLSDNLIQARNTMHEITYDALNDDPLFQKILDCSKFLSSMLISGTFDDDPVCH